MEDLVPTEDDIEFAVKRLQNHRFGGTSGMRAEHLKDLLEKARKEEAAEAKSAATEGTTALLGGTGVEETERKLDKATAHMKNWEKVVALVRFPFGEGILMEGSIWKAVALTLKGKGDYRGIGLMELMSKVVADILNRHITDSITYHYFLRGLQAGTASLEAKLLQPLADLREEVLYVIFLDLHKAFDAMDRDRFLGIPLGYGVGPQHFRLPQIYRDQIRMVVKARGYYRLDFQGFRGVTQG